MMHKRITRWLGIVIVIALGLSMMWGVGAWASETDVNTLLTQLAERLDNYGVRLIWVEQRNQEQDTRLDQLEALLFGDTITVTPEPSPVIQQTAVPTIRPLPTPTFTPTVEPTPEPCSDFDFKEQFNQAVKSLLKESGFPTRGFRGVHLWHGAHISNSFAYQEVTVRKVIGDFSYRNLANVRLEARASVLVDDQTCMWLTVNME